MIWVARITTSRPTATGSEVRLTTSNGESAHPRTGDHHPGDRRDGAAEVGCLQHGDHQIGRVDAEAGGQMGDELTKA